jgi:signal recognition particle subunit SRP54
MLGQDAVTSAKEFDRKIGVTGLILTKADGDARGGAILTIREITGRPVRYVGVGEKLDKIEAFDPDRMARRILGMGDVLGLVEQAQEVVDQEQAQETAERLFMDRFTLDDLRHQLEAMRKMGSMRDMLKKIPGLATLDEAQMAQLPSDDEMSKWRAAIDSMTPQERMDPSLLHMQRRHRVARGSGTSLAVISDVLKAHKEMKRQVKDLKSKGILGRMAGRALGKAKSKRLKDLKDRGVDVGGWFETG